MGIFDWQTPSRTSDEGVPLPQIPVEIYEEVFSYTPCPESYLVDCESEESICYRHSFCSIALVCRYFSAYALSRLYSTIRLFPFPAAGWPSFTPFCYNLIAVSILSSRNYSSVKEALSTNVELAALGPLVADSTPSDTEVKTALELSPLVKAVVLDDWTNPQDQSRSASGITAGFLKMYLKGVSLLPNLDTLVFRNTTFDDALLGFIEKPLSLRITTLHTVECSFSFSSQLRPLLSNVTELTSRIRNSKRHPFSSPASVMGLVDTAKLSRVMLYDLEQLRRLLGENPDALEYFSLYVSSEYEQIVEGGIILALLLKHTLKALELPGLRVLLPQPLSQSLQRLASQRCSEDYLPDLQSATISTSFLPFLPIARSSIRSLRFGAFDDGTSEPPQFTPVFAHARTLQNLCLSSYNFLALHRSLFYASTEHFVPFVALKSLRVQCGDVSCIEKIISVIEGIVRYRSEEGNAYIDHIDASRAFPVLGRIAFDFEPGEYWPYQATVEEQKRLVSQLSKCLGTLREVSFNEFVWLWQYGTTASWYLASDTDAVFSF